MSSPPKRPEGPLDSENLPDDPELLKKRVWELSTLLGSAQSRIEELETRSPEPQLKVLSEQLERQAMLLERDEHVARELQRSLRPVLDEAVPGLEYAIETKPGTRVGGDFYDIINLGDKFVAFLIADVSGYGLPAAVIMATGRLAFRTYAANELDPRVIMDSVNRTMLRSTLAGHYLTAFLAVLDTELLTLRYVNASHCSPFIMRGGEAIPLDTEGLFVGMFEDPQYEQKGMQLEKDDQIFFYTDGLLRGFEAKDRHEAQSKLQQYLQDSDAQDVQELIDRLGALLPEPEDDVALMGVKLLLEKAKRKTIVISSIPREVAHVENAILPVLENKGWGQRAVFGIQLALEEAAINSIKHGNELDDTKRVTVSFGVDEERCVISIADEGPGFDPDALPDPTEADNLLATSGRGVALIRAYMDEVRFNESGNEITMIKYAPWASAKHS